MTNLPKDADNQGLGVKIIGSTGNISGDIVGRDKIVHGLDENKIIALLEHRGLMRVEMII
jgi:hypothetical protein